MKAPDATRGGSRYGMEGVAPGIGTLHLLHAQLAKVSARCARISIEMREADAQGARKEVTALFEERCDLILSAARIEISIETELSTTSVPVSD